MRWLKVFLPRKGERRPTTDADGPTTELSSSPTVLWLVPWTEPPLMALLVFLNCCFGISAANGLGDEEEITEEANEEEDKPKNERPPPALDEEKAAELFEVPNKFGDAAENADENDIEVPNKFAVENADENDIEVPNKFGDAVENADENNGYDDDGGGVSADADFEDETGSVGDAVAMSLIAACWI